GGSAHDNARGQVDTVVECKRFRRRFSTGIPSGFRRQSAATGSPPPVPSGRNPIPTGRRGHTRAAGATPHGTVRDFTEDGHPATHLDWVTRQREQLALRDTSQPHDQDAVRTVVHEPTGADLFK